MKNTLSLLFIILFVSTLSAQQKRSRNEIEFGTPVYYDQILNTLTYPLAWENSGIKSHKKWNRVAREKLLECLSPMPPKADFDMKVLATEQRQGYKAHKVELNISGWSRIVAYLLVPDQTGKKPMPALVMLHDHGAEFYIGKEKMVRPFDEDSTVIVKAQSWVDNLYSGKYVGDEYAKNGYVVFSADALFWGDRGRKEGVNYDGQQALSANLLQMGMSWTGIMTSDDMRSVDFLASLPYVDAENIGAVGFSMGAHRAWMLSAAMPQVKASAAICWISSNRVLMTPKNNQLKGGSAYAMLVPGIRNYMDYPHVASLTAPRAMLFFNGDRDKLFPVHGVEEAYKIMKGVWQKTGKPENLVTRLYENTPHIFNAEMQAETILFFDKHLKKESEN